MRIGLFLACLLYSALAGAQYKTFRLSDKGDTLNAIDMKGLKQGRWSIHVNPLRGEPGYDEEGVFVNNRKEGIWRRFNTMGDPIAVESYRWGNKNGISRYFTIDGLEREESWRAINPDKAFDTLDVADLINPNKFDKVIVKNEGASLKHGTWKYYAPGSGKLLGTDTYFLDKLQDPAENKSLATIAKPVSDTAKTKTPEKVKPKEVSDFEKKTSGKKKAVRTGSTGG